ncbi:hypothetical protein HWV00_01805 [Moritella sp. 24]|uniref:hypothetical protein n=1 Tax=Moritella sp. 24 TaxID=2746230 RepID=UPI001BA6EC3E|nr:hypothetical protein [Moritella sp. 24]QUM75075.1 hypothetical protein HWV00_01805 [Moritella sp. 24]
MNGLLNTARKTPFIEVKKVSDDTKNDLRLIKESLAWNADLSETEPMLPCGDSVINWDSYSDGYHELTESGGIISVLDCDVDRDDESLLKVFVVTRTPVKDPEDLNVFESWHGSYKYTGIPNAILDAYDYMNPLLNLSKQNKLTALAIVLERFVSQSDLEVEGSASKGIIALIEHTLS